MVNISIYPGELFDNDKQEFITLDKKIDLQLEHSLLSISKWEAIYCKPFLSEGSMDNVTAMIDYIKCMTIGKEIDTKYYYLIRKDDLDKIQAYINAPMTATTFRKQRLSGRREIITSELIYYWMIADNIPFECQKWHLNRLLTLIHICSIKNTPAKKMTKKETAANYAAINKARRAKYHTSG